MPAHPCPNCDYATDRKCNLVRHSASCSASHSASLHTASNDEVWRCVKCGKKFGTFHAYKAHSQHCQLSVEFDFSDAGSSRVPRKRLADSQETTDREMVQKCSRICRALPGCDVVERRCEYCKCKYYNCSVENFLTHTRHCRRNPNKSTVSFQCSYCTKSFFRRSNLLLHVSRKHRGGARRLPVIATGKKSHISLREKYDSEIRQLTRGELDPQLLLASKIERKRDNNKFGVQQKEVVFRFSSLSRKLAGCGYFLHVLRAVFEHLVEFERLKRVKGLVSLLLDGGDLDYPISSARQLGGKNFSFENFLDNVARCLNSQQSLGTEEDLYLQITVIDGFVSSARDVVKKKRKPLVGLAASRRKRRGLGGHSLRLKQITTLRNWCDRKRGLLDPSKLQNSQLKDACMALCISIALSYRSLSRVKQLHWWSDTTRRRDLPKLLYIRMRQLYTFLEKPLYSALGDADLRRIQAFLNQFNRQLLVYSLGDDTKNGLAILFRGEPRRLPKQQIKLLFIDDHCTLITDVAVFKGPVWRYCNQCCELVGEADPHECDRRCRACYSTACIDGSYLNRSLRCGDCDRHFRTGFCFDNHRWNGICKLLKYCRKCNRTVKAENLTPPDQHGCGMRKCKFCRKMVPANGHVCYIQRPTNIEKDANNLRPKRYCFFDLECIHKTDGTMPHTPVLITAIRCCQYCIEKTDIEADTWCCGHRRLAKFTRPDRCLRDFIEWACFDKANKNMICFSHFGSGYDSILVFAELMRMGHKPSKVLSRGCKLLSFTAGFNVAFRDSYLFFRCSLAKLPSLFGVEASKDFFPMQWLGEGNRFLHYKGVLPPASAFEPARMDDKRRAEFENFYRKESVANRHFDFFDTLLKYCIADSVCLWHTCAKFRHLVMKLCDGIDPLRHAVTLASLTSVIYRYCFLPNFESEDQGIVISLDRDLPGEARMQQSRMAVKFLDWINYSRPELPKILKADDYGKEMKVCGVPVDGYVPPTTPDGKPTIIQVHGCFWHGCLKQHHTRSLFARHPIHKWNTWLEVWRRTKDADLRLRRDGRYNFVAVWECDITSELRLSADMFAFFNDEYRWRHLAEPLRMRDALLGGRTAASILLAELSRKAIEDGYQISYYDFNSLYPFVMEGTPGEDDDEDDFWYPIGQPDIIRGHQLPGGPYAVDPVLLRDTYRGLAKVFIVPPPKDSLAGRSCFGSIPYRKKDGTSAYPFCRSCFERNDHRLKCEHQSDEERGMLVTLPTCEIFEACSKFGYKLAVVYEILHFPYFSNELFAPYIQTWKKIKYQNSGWPKGISRKRYLRWLREKEGIVLQEWEIVDNPALRTLAKMVLNSLWGKFGIRLDVVNRLTRFLSKPSQLSKIFQSKKYNLQSANLIDDSTLMVTLDTEEAWHDPSVFSNVPIACFVTAWARMKLNRVLQKLQFKALYFDTDSVIFYHKGAAPIRSGLFFGELKSELDYGSFITRFVSLAAKLYSYTTNTGKSSIRAKGFSFSDERLKKRIDFDRLKAVLLSQSEEVAAFYNAVEDPELAERLRIAHEATASKISRFEHQSDATAVIRDNFEISRDDSGPGVLLLPNPSIQNRLKTDNPCLVDKLNGTKMMRFNFRKRQVYIHSRPFHDIANIRSLPWGWGAAAKPLDWRDFY